MQGAGPIVGGYLVAHLVTQPRRRQITVPVEADDGLFTSSIAVLKAALTAGIMWG